MTRYNGTGFVCLGDGDQVVVVCVSRLERCEGSIRMWRRRETDKRQGTKVASFLVSHPVASHTLARDPDATTAHHCVTPTTPHSGEHLPRHKSQADNKTLHGSLAHAITLPQMPQIHSNW